MKRIELMAIARRLVVCGPLFRDFDPIQTPAWMDEVSPDSFILPPPKGSTSWLVCKDRGWVLGELVVNHGVPPSHWGYYPLPEAEKLESWYLEEEWRSLQEGCWATDVAQLRFVYPDFDQEDQQDGMVQAPHQIEKD